MALVSNILVQAAPAGTGEVLFYTVPSGGHTRIDEVSVCNRSATPTAFRLSISIKGSPTSAKDYLYYDLPIAGNDTFVNEFAPGVTLHAGDAIRIVNNAATLTFTLFGEAT